MALSADCEEAMRRLLALPAGTTIATALADESAKALDGILQVLDGWALLTGARGRPDFGRSPGSSHRRRNWLPARPDGGRAFLAIEPVELFWVLTACRPAPFTISLCHRVAFPEKGDPPSPARSQSQSLPRLHPLCCNHQIRSVIPEPSGVLLRHRSFLIPVGFATARSRTLQHWPYAPPWESTLCLSWRPPTR